MEELLNRLVTQAKAQGAVAQAVLDSGMRLFVYPLDKGQLAALGWPHASGHVVHGETLMARRGANMARYGAWLPALFADGGWYVARRIGVDDGAGLPDDAQLRAAEELLQ